MSQVWKSWSIVALAVGLAGCAGRPIAQTENMLSAAGFASKPAVTPQQIASLHALPPHKFSRQMHNGKLVWLYADPTICGCVYAGDETNFQAYSREVFAQNLADEQQLSAEMNEDAAMQMGWGGWGDYGF